MITYPLNNILYSAEDAELFHCTRTSGVFSADDEFAVSVTGADNTVVIGPGIAWIRNAKFSGKVAANKTSVSLDMGLADGSYPRIDAVVIQFDANANQTSIVVKQGVAASSPTPPEVVQTEALYELHIYHVRRSAGAAVVSAADISDMRQDRNYCGVMMDDVTNIDENKFLAKTAYDPTGTVEAAGGIPAYIAENAPKTTVVDSVTSTSKTSAASAASVKKAYDQAVAAKNAIPALSSSVSSTSTTTAANSYAVKQVYDKVTNVETGSPTIVTGSAVQSVNQIKIGRFCVLDLSVSIPSGYGGIVIELKNIAKRLSSVEPDTIPGLSYASGRNTSVGLAWVASGNAIITVKYDQGQSEGTCYLRFIFLAES